MCSAVIPTKVRQPSPGCMACKIIKIGNHAKYHLRSFLKKSSINAAHSPASTPAVTCVFG